MTGDPDPLQARAAAGPAVEVLEGLPHGVCTLAPRYDAGGAVTDLEFTYLNPVAARLLGTTADSLAGTLLHDVLPEYPPDLFARLLAVLEDGDRLRERRQPFAGRRRDGTEVIGLFDITAVRVGAEVMLVYEDVTAAQRDQDEAARYRALLEATPDWVSIATGDGTLLYVNPGGRRMVGLHPEADVVGEQIGTFSPDWVRDRTEQEILPVVRAEGFWRGDLARQHADGHEIPVSQVVIAGAAEDGEVAWYATIARDMTRERLAAQALRESEERFRITFEQAPIGIALSDLEGRLVQVNDAYCATLRRTREELIGRTVASITHPDDLELTAHAIGDTIEGQRRSPTFVEKRYLDPAGETIWVEISGSLLRDSEGRPQYVMGQVQDVSDRRVAQVLQRSMLTTRLPRVAGLEVSVRYLPAAGDAEVSGDWYDLIENAGGRVTIAIGDVVGRGVEAAATMSQLRTALRAYAADGMGPGAIVQRLHRLVDRLGDGLSTTLALLELDPATGALRTVGAGHLPPVLLSPGGGTRLLEQGRSTPLGTAPLGPAPREGETVMRPGETLLLYTDGLVERRATTLDDRLALLGATMAQGPEPLERLLDHVVVTLLADDEARHDDVAMLAVRLLVPEQEPLDIELTGGAGALSGARAALRTWLAEAGASQEDVTDVLLAAGEACANAVEHGAPPVRLRARRDGARIVLTVTDRGDWTPPERSTDRGHGLRLMRLVMDAVRVVPTEEGTQLELRRRLRSHGERPRVTIAPPLPAGATVRTIGDVPVAHLSGEVDREAVEGLREALDAGTPPGAPGLVMDLTAVTYLDSAGLHLLFELSRTLGARGQRLRVSAPREHTLSRLLERTGLDRSIPLHPTADEARAALTRATG